MPASDLTLLLRAIISDPADDTARLAYADCVQEAGDDARAAFIRVQVERERSGLVECRRQVPPGPGAANNPHRVNCRRCPWCLLMAREQELRGPHNQGDWPANIYEWFIRHLPGGMEITVSRGFVSHLTTTAELFLAHADALIWHPEQTMKCTARGCENGTIGRPSRVGVSGHGAKLVCDACDGSGRVPRPFPGTAQPVTDVTLTTTPEFYSEMNIISGAGRHTRWPGVRFTLTTINYADISLTPYSLTGAIRVPNELLADAGASLLPRECATPADGWFIAADRQDRDIEYHRRMYSMIGQTTYTLTVRFTPEENTRPPAPGATLRDLTATDRLGTRYRVPSAILTRVDHHAGRNRFDVELTAIASSTPEVF